VATRRVLDPSSLTWKTEPSPRSEASIKPIRKGSRRLIERSRSDLARSTPVPFPILPQHQAYEEQIWKFARAGRRNGKAGPRAAMSTNGRLSLRMMKASVRCWDGSPGRLGSRRGCRAVERFSNSAFANGADIRAPAGRMRLRLACIWSIPVGWSRPRRGPCAGNDAEGVEGTCFI